MMRSQKKRQGMRLERQGFDMICLEIAFVLGFCAGLCVMALFIGSKRNYYTIE